MLVRTSISLSKSTLDAAKRRARASKTSVSRVVESALAREAAVEERLARAERDREIYERNADALNEFVKGVLEDQADI